MIKNKLILGTVQFGLNYGINNLNGKLGDQEVFEILEYATANSITTLDTASAYGNSEEIIGNFLSHNPNKFDVITKVKLENVNSFEEALDNCLNKLKLNKVQYIMFHSFEDYLKIQKEIPSINQKLKGIKYDKIGVSIYENEEIEIVSNDNNIDLIQVPFNLFDNDFHKGELLKKAKIKGKIIHVRSIFLQGLFYKNLFDLPKNLLKLSDYLQLIHGLAKENNLSISELSIKYVMAKTYIDGVLFGVDSLDQLNSNIKNSKGTLDAHIESKIDNIKIIETELLNPSKW